jgi:hypothetical protein
MDEDLTIYFTQAEDSLQATRSLKFHGLYKKATMAIFGLLEVYFLVKTYLRRLIRGCKASFQQCLLHQKLFLKNMGSI